MTRIIAHRGDSAHAPENTLRAFARAIDRGADLIELDLQRSSDGDVFAFHDLDLDRLTAETGLASERPMDALREIAVLPGRYAPAPDTCIPSLDEVLRFIDDRVPLYLEIKAEAAGLQPHLLEALVDRCLEHLEPDGPHHLASFHLGVVRHCLDAGHAPILIASDPRRLGELTHPQQERLHAFSVFHERIDEAVALDCRVRRIPLWAWTVSDPRDVDRMLELDDVSALCTNDVGFLRALLEVRGEHV